jgi:glutaredoxin
MRPTALASTVITMRRPTTTTTTTTRLPPTVSFIDIDTFPSSYCSQMIDDRIIRIRCNNISPLYSSMGNNNNDDDDDDKDTVRATHRHHCDRHGGMFRNNSNHNNINRQKKADIASSAATTDIIIIKQNHFHDVATLLLMIVTASFVLLFPSTSMTFPYLLQKNNNMAYAAPPVEIIAQELGYFPVRNQVGNIMYLPKSIHRSSTHQAISLSQQLQTQYHATMYGTYWCPHCARQKELLGQQAFQYIQYIECDAAGYQAQSKLCQQHHIDGYPTWILLDGSSSSRSSGSSSSNKQEIRLNGEQSLTQLANVIGMTEFDPSLETNVPPPIGSNAACL